MMIEQITAFQEHEALLSEHRAQKVREAVEKAKAIVEDAKKHSERISWFKAFQKLLLKYHRRLPRSIIHLAHSGLTNPLIEVCTLSLDPSYTKYWAHGSVIYDRLRGHDQSSPSRVQVVYAGFVEQGDLPRLLEVLEAARKEDFSSGVFIPDNTALVEWEDEVYTYEGRARVGTEWCSRASKLEVSTSNLDSVVKQFRWHRKKQRGVIAVRNVSVYLPGLNNKVSPEIDEMRVPTVLSSEAVAS